MNQITIDLHAPKAFETIFPEELIDFHTQINFTTCEEDVFQLVSALARRCGFDATIYEYCPDIHAAEPDLFMRTDLPRAFEALERSSSRKGHGGYSRMHAREKWTPTVAGHEFADLYSDYPSQVWKYRLAALVSGLRSGFGVALRSSDPASRAGMAFASKLPRAEFESMFREHRLSLYAAAWAGHIRILQHARQAKSPENLTQRQLHYISLLARGLLDKQIAHEMGISHSAVRKHQYAVTRRLKVERRGEIVPTAIQIGILNDEQKQTDQPSVKWDIKVM